MRENILLDCAEAELEMHFRAWTVADTDKLKPSTTGVYVEAEPMKLNNSTKKIDRDGGAEDGQYPVWLNYDPPGLIENQTVGKTTVLTGGTFHAWIHPDMFDASAGAKTPAAGNKLMCGVIQDATPADRAYRGFMKLSTATGTYYCVGEYLYYETKNGISYRYCELRLPGDLIYVA